MKTKEPFVQKLVHKAAQGIVRRMNATAGRRTVPGVLTSPTGLKSPYLSRRTKSKQIRDF